MEEEALYDDVYIPSNPSESPKRPGPGAEEKVSGDGGLNPESVLNRLSIFFLVVICVRAPEETENWVNAKA